jgi:hypothetical protein
MASSSAASVQVAEEGPDALQRPVRTLRLTRGGSDLAVLSTLTERCYPA